MQVFFLTILLYDYHIGSISYYQRIWEEDNRQIEVMNDLILSFGHNIKDQLIVSDTLKILGALFAVCPHFY